MEFQILRLKVNKQLQYAKIYLLLIKSDMHVIYQCHVEGGGLFYLPYESPLVYIWNP